MRQQVITFCSLFPIAFIAGAVLPFSAILPLSLIWTFSGKRWFGIACSAFLVLRVADLELVYMFLARSLESLGVAPGLVQTLSILAMTAILSSFLLDAWLIKRWAQARISTHAPGLLSFGRIAR